MRSFTHTKKALAVLLTALMLITSISSGAIASAAFLRKLNITVSAPVVGENPSYDAATSNSGFIVMDENYGYIYNGVTWYDWTADSNVDKDDVFIKGHVYGVTVLIENAPGNSNDVINITINDNAAEFKKTTDDEGNPYYIVEYIFGEKPVADDETADIIIAEPVAGELPSYEATIGNESFEIFKEEYGYIYDGVTWYDVTADSNIDKGDYFIQNHTYRVTVLVKKADGVEIELTKATVNRVAAEISETTDDYGDPYYLISYQFGEYVENDETIVNITAEAPEIGKKPNFSLKHDSYYFELASLNEGYVVDGVAWLDETSYSNMDDTDVFFANHTYSLYAYMVKTDEFDLTGATVNGLEAQVDEITIDDVPMYMIKYQFGQYIEIDYTSINILAEAPVVGGTPNFTVQIDSTFFKISDLNEGYVFDGVSWYDETIGSNVDKDDLFFGNHTYSISIYLEKTDEMNLETAWVNGIESQVDEITIDDVPMYIVKCQFGEYITLDYSTVNIIATEPSAGHSPDFNVEFDNDFFKISNLNDGYVVDGVAWMDTTLYSNLDTADVFFDNHTYTLYVYFEKAEGTEFDLTTAYVNGNEAQVDEITIDDIPMYMVAYQFGKYHNLDYTSVNILATKPEMGKTPDFNVKFDNDFFEISNLNDGYVVDGVAWLDSTIYSNMDESDVFFKNHTYTLYVYFEKAEGTEFDLETAYVNGKEAQVDEITIDDIPMYMVTYQFGKYIEQNYTQQNIMVAEPKAGENPAYTILTDNDLFVLQDLNEGYVFDGIAWYDRTFDTNITAEDTFLEGHTYTLSIYMEKSEGCDFDLWTATINGNNVEIYNADDYYIISYDFHVATNKPIVTYIDIYGVDTPVAGSRFDYQLTFGNEGYKTADINNATTVNGISWFDYTTESYVNTTDVCLEGHDYAVIIHLEAKDGYILLPQIAFINNKEVGFSHVNGYVTTEGYFEYVDPIIRSIELTDVELPVDGYLPDYTITRDSDKYEFESKNDAYFVDGVAWFDLTDSIYLVAGVDTFIADHTYMLELYLVPQDGFSFNLTSATLNGKAITDIWGAGGRVVLYYTFDPCEAPTDISITINTNGGNADYVPKIELINLETEQVIYDAEAYNVYPGNNTYFICRLDFVYPTNYIMKVTMEGCATRYYPINVSSFSWAFNADLFATGDVNMDGSINVLDYQSTVNLALDDCEVPRYDTESDYEYTKALADITGDGIIDVIDCFYAEKRA